MITFETANELDYPINEALIKKCVRAFDKALKPEAKKSFSLAFIDGRTMRKFNKSYRGKDKSTDVLSFASADEDEDFYAGNQQSETGELGEILICFPVATKQAKEYHWTVDEEICRLLVHGLAHLSGYDHENVSLREAKRMTDFEKSVMKILG